MARRRHRPPIPPRLPRPPPETSGPRPRHGIQRGAVLQAQPQLSRSHPARAFLFPRHPRPLHGADWLPPWTRPLLRPGAALWDPATGCRCSVAVPPMFDDKEIVVWNGAVLCAAGDEGHVHGDCHSSPILIGIHRDNNRAFASVYSSEAGTWGELISTAAIRNMYDLNRPGTLVGDSVYWVFDDHEDGILRFDLDRHSLFNIEMPDLRYYRRPNSFKILRADDGSVGLAILEYQKFQMWERKVGSDGVAGWMLQKTFQMNTILGLGPMGGGDNLMLGYDEDDHEIIYFFLTLTFSIVQSVSDLSVCERRVGGIPRPLAKDVSIMFPASVGVGAAGDTVAAASFGTVAGGDTLDKTHNRVQGIDTGLVPSRVLTQTRIDVIFKKEKETRSKLSKAWAKWFHSNSVPESKADCPHFRSAMKLTQQLGT
uniref:F-box protein AT5G49610-like beta-propeller domain-containing protein n=1 Tax=Aegilops tauschii TaxID=37682 RepID=M8C418_AEGTA